MVHDRKLIPALLLLVWLAAVPVLAGGDANVLLGQEWLGDAELEAAEVDQQTEYGVALTLDFDWPVALAFDLTTSSADDTRTLGSGSSLETEVETLELALGVRKLWRERLRPFVGGGLAWIQLSAEQTETVSIGGGGTVTSTVVDDSGAGVGFWLNAGLLYRLGSHFDLGLDLRYSDAEADIQPVGAGELTLDSGGTHAGLLLGYHW